MENVNSHESGGEGFHRPRKQISQCLLHQMDSRVKLTLFWSGSLGYTGVTFWHGKQALTLVSTILSMHGNHTFSSKITLNFTMPQCPSWAMSTIRSCSALDTTRRFKQDSISTSQLLATQEFVSRNENRKRSFGTAGNFKQQQPQEGLFNILAILDSITNVDVHIIFVEVVNKMARKCKIKWRNTDLNVSLYCPDFFSPTTLRWSPRSMGSLPKGMKLWIGSAFSGMPVFFTFLTFRAQFFLPNEHKIGNILARKKHGI